MGARFIELKNLVSRYIPLAERLGDKRRLARLLFEVGYAHTFSGTPSQGLELTERSLELSRELDDDQGVGLASLGLAWHYIYFAPAIDDSGQVLDVEQGKARSRHLRHQLQRSLFP